MKIQMMSTLKSLIVLCVFVSSLVCIADGPRARRIDRRESNQQKRIQQGVQSGALTPGETNALEKGQEHVQNLETKAKADGVVTPEEKARITAAQNRQSRKIYRLKHNGRQQAEPTPPDTHAPDHQ